MSLKVISMYKYVLLHYVASSLISQERMISSLNVVLSQKMYCIVLRSTRRHTRYPTRTKQVLRIHIHNRYNWSSLLYHYDNFFLLNHRKNKFIIE